MAIGDGKLGVPSRGNSRNCEYSLAKDHLSWKRGPFSENLIKGNLRDHIRVSSSKVLLGAASSHLRNVSCLFSFFSPLSPIASMTALAPVLIFLYLDVPFPCGDGGSSFL